MDQTVADPEGDMSGMYCLTDRMPQTQKVAFRSHCLMLLLREGAAQNCSQPATKPLSRALAGLPSKICSVGLRLTAVFLTLAEDFVGCCCVARSHVDLLRTAIGTPCRSFLTGFPATSSSSLLLRTGQSDWDFTSRNPVTLSFLVALSVIGIRPCKVRSAILLFLTRR